MKGLFAGLSTVDLAYLVAGFPDEDSKATALAQVTAAGGPAANAAVAFSCLAGGGARLVTALGRHWLTGLVRDELREQQVEIIDLAPEAATAPPVSSIIVSQQTASRTIVSLDATQMQARAPERPSALIGDAGIVLVDGHQAGACAAIAQAATTAGVPVVFDGGRWKASHRDLLRHVDVAICSGRFDPGEGDAHDYLHSLGVRYVATTNGDRPIRWSSPDSGGLVNVPTVAAVDTLGAGDIFHGAFCYYFAAGHDFPSALADAAAVGAASCERFGTRAWMDSGRARFPLA